MYILETSKLTHKYSAIEVAINNLNIQVPEGSIYGFLGPNGAGKTTTLRLILGLLKRQQGDILVFGESLEKNRLDILQKVGSLIESPSIYSHLSATENLKVLQKIYRCSNERIPELLHLVDLSNTGNKKVGKFSLGMKQRLSIAIALLNNPKLLILDEPTNGLDPNGIIEMRTFLKKINQDNKITIVVSSHLLTEIEKVVTHVGIINKGQLLFQGTLEELMTKQQQSALSIIKTSDNEESLRIITTLNISASVKDDQILMAALSKEKIGEINLLLARQNIIVYEIGVINNDLETIFIDFIK